MPLDYQAQINVFRWIQVASANVAGTPFLTPQPFTPAPQAFAHFTMAPRTPHGMETTGLLFMLQNANYSGNTGATAGAGGFTVTPWMVDPGATIWGSGASFSASYNQLFTTFDFDAGMLYFQITNVSVAGNLFIGICEQ